MNRRRVACYAGPRRWTRCTCVTQTERLGRATSASQCIDEVTPDEPSFLSGVWDNPMNEVRACARLEAGCAAQGEARRRVRSVGAWQQWQRSRFARDRTGSAASERIPANWQFQRTGATGREPSRTDRTQEVAGSSPASSMTEKSCSRGLCITLRTLNRSVLQPRWSGSGHVATSLREAITFRFEAGMQ
jgi:hypothetical protein